MTGHTLAALPEWDEGTAATLATVSAAGAPHAIPVSTALRTGPTTIVLGLAGRRVSLAHLRARPAVALCVVGAGVAFTAEGTATVLVETLDAAPGVTAVRLDVATIHDHRQPAFALEAPVAWRWTDDEAAARDAAVRAGLRGL
jgi:Pyridoxamine 5'-phosphate oxidase